MDQLEAETEALDTLKTILYAPPPAIAHPKDVFRGLSPLEPPVPSAAWLVVEPALQALGLYVPPDATYGRYLIPPLAEERYLESSPRIRTTKRRIFTDRQATQYPSAAETASDNKLPSGGPTSASARYKSVLEAENVELTQAELDRAKGREWVFWQAWELRDRRGRPGEGCDLLCVHGIGDYGGRWSIHVARFVEAGFRVIAPDLPSHGHSSGLHCYIWSMEPLVDALRLVLDDVRASDLAMASSMGISAQESAEAGEKPTKLFLSGASLGGFICLKFLFKYPPVNIDNHGVDGLFLMCPLITISPETRPSYALELLGRALQSFMGRVPIAAAQRGKGHKDPRVEISFLANPQPYHGPLRIATGLTISNALVGFERHAAELTVPVKAIHGAEDRITNPKSTERFIGQVASIDKEVEIWPGYEHVMNAVGYDHEMDAPRQKTLQSWFEWVTKHV